MASHYVELVCASAPTECVHTEERTEMQKYNIENVVQDSCQINIHVHMYIIFP